jgi:hypothetical protein
MSRECTNLLQYGLGQLSRDPTRPQARNLVVELFISPAPDTSLRWDLHGPFLRLK